MEAQKSTFDPTTNDLNGQDPFDDQLLLNLIKRCKTSGKAKRQKLARDWFRSELFYNGVQWVTFDAKLRRWRESGLKKTTPKPVTNKYASYSDLLSSLIASIPVEVTYRPLTSGDEMDQTKTNLANELVDAIGQVTHIKDKQRDAAPMLVRQGEVYLIPRLTKETGNDFKAPEDNLDQLSELGSENPEESQLHDNPLSSLGLGDMTSSLNEAAHSDPEIPKLSIDVASTFECYVDEDADSLDDSLFFAREKSYDVSILKELYPDKEDKIVSTQNLAGDISRYFAGTLQRLTSGEWGQSGYFVSSDQTGSKRANMTEFWHDPCKNYPEGIYAIMVNDNVIVHKGPLQFSDNGKFKKNIVHIRCKKRTKNIHGRTPLDDAIPKQIQRNRMESFIELIIYRMAAPHWLLPKDCGIESISGEPGTSMVYNRVSASQTSVLKPEMIQGIPPAPVLISWLDKIDRDCEDILGITPALLGEMPAGTPAARLVELLMQRSKERHGDVFAEWNSKWAECINMLLKIVRVAKPVDLFNVTKRTFGGFAIKQFQEGDYDLNIDIVPETEQPAPPRSTAAEMQIVEDLAAKGVFQMPQPLLYEIMNRFGFDYLIKPLKSDKEYISREHYELTKNNVPPIMKVFDNHPMHFEDHRVFRQSDEYSEWAKNFKDQAASFEQHILAHQDQMHQQQAPQGPPGPQPMPQLAA